MCLAGTVVASWSLAQGVAGLNPFTVMKTIFVTAFSEFRENIKEKLHCSALWIGFRTVSYLQDKKEGGDRETWSSFSSIKAKMNLTNWANLDNVMNSLVLPGLIVCWLSTLNSDFITCTVKEISFPKL